jgi:peroxiredoxin
MHYSKGGLLIAAALALAVISPATARVMKGQASPEFTGTALDGRKVSLSDFRGKNPVLLSFFAAPSRKELPRLKELDEAHGAKGLRVIAVSLDEDRATAASLAAQTRVKFPVLLDPKGSIAEKYGVQAIPHLVVIDRQGKVQAVIIGTDDEKLGEAVGQVVK